MKKIPQILTFAAMALAAGAAVPAQALTDAEIEQKVADLISQMTLDEKIGQLNHLSAGGYDDNMAGMIKAGMVGSLLNVNDPETANRFQKDAMENSRLHIPLVYARDVIHGYRTIFPIPLGQAATWNPEIVREGSRIAADEASSAGIRWTYSPMIDIARDPRWGRIAEGYGEDTYLTSVMGEAAVKGYQGDDLSAPNSMAATAKHFAGYGAAESGIDYNTTWIPEVQLRETYLPPFKRAVDAGAATVMCSFNDINGVPSSGNRHLLTDILRDEWGFDGALVSDWGSINMMKVAGFSKDDRQAAEQAIKAGVDLDMMSYAYMQYLKDLVEQGVVSEEKDIDPKVANVLRLKYRLGLFENPYVDMATANRFYAPASLDAARKAVEESAILLKNDGIFPLKKGVKIAVIGPMADNKHDQAGTWSFDLEKEKSVTPLESLREKYGKENIIYVKALEHTRDRSDKGFAEALKAAEEADVILFFGGEEAVLSGEAHSRADITLPGAQKELLRELKRAGKPLAMIIQAGRSLAIMDDVDLTDATVFMFHGGTMAGPGLVNLLSGDVNFSGRSPLSFPRMSGQVPIYYNHKSSGRPAAGYVLIDDLELEAGQTSTGCTSYYLDAGDGPAYPFGYGLSYTTFSYSDPVLSKSVIGNDENLEVSCTVTNTGDVEGKEVAQLYVRDLVGSEIRPVRELKGFEKISLKPGESKTVNFTITPEDLKFWHLDGSRYLEPGEFSVWVAPDALAGNAVNFEVK